MIDKEQMIEDLHFLSDQGNYKSIKYAIECIDKLEKIKQIIDDCDLGMISCEQLFLNLRTILEQETSYGRK